MTNDNMLEGDSGASGVARRLRRTAKPPLPLRINTPAHVASNFEGLVHRIDGTLWKLVRVFDDPATWTEPGVRHLAASGGPGPDTYRSSRFPISGSSTTSTTIRSKRTTVGTTSKRLDRRRGVRPDADA